MLRQPDAVLQRYVARPLLINNRKLSLRLYSLVTCAAPLHARRSETVAASESGRQPLSHRHPAARGLATKPWPSGPIEECA